ncbi:zinc finger CCCH-type antiviral protein 1 [Suncus etruscus]|uniref:zinc finger CCCH-type antiviral protein 1 n=1 Tax=Suncus etruscus TaxID=109475 RepID=UPI002110CDA8|nr:zinc finger CCCH-type antiviral protein 1 [Suncus etruscus]
MADSEVCAFITKVLCAHGGRLPLARLLDQVQLPEAQLREVLRAAGPERFVLLETGEPDGVTQAVLAAARVRICRRKTCHQPCGNLHLCKQNLLERCRYSQRNLCKYSHEILSADNEEILAEHGLLGLNEKELTVLLIQNDPFFLPEICKSYKGENRKQTCLQQPLCEQLHICEHFTRGNCGFPNCLRSHNLMDRKVLAVMRKHGLSTELVQNIQDICNSKHSRRRPSSRKGAPIYRRGGPPKGRDQSRETPRESFGSIEFLSSTLLSAQGSRTPSPDSLGSPLDDVSSLISQLQNLESQEGSPPVLVYPKAAGVGAPNSAKGSQQQLLKNGGPHPGVSEDSNSCHISNVDPRVKWKGPESWLKVQAPKGEVLFPPSFDSIVPSAPILNPETFQDISLETEIRKNISAQGKLVDTRQAKDRPFTRDFHNIATGCREREKVSLVSPNHRALLKNQGSLCDIETLLEGHGPNEPLSPLLGAHNTDVPAATGPLHDKLKTLEKKVNDWMLDSQSPFHARSQISHSTTDDDNLHLAALSPGIPREKTLKTQQSIHAPVVDLGTKAKAPSGQAGGHGAYFGSSPAVRKGTDDSGARTEKRCSAQPQKKEGSMAKDDDNKNIICLNHLLKQCPSAQNCHKVHFHLPYQWQIFTRDAWNELQPLETIEKMFCDPQKSIFSIGNRTINFQDMTCNSDSIRRISTLSSVRSVSAKESLFATKWIWYWRNKTGTWIEYGKRDNQGCKAANVDSTYLETIYSRSSKDVVLTFVVGQQTYELNLRAMIQTNINTKAQKKVLRRPVFVSAWNVEQKIRGLAPSPVKTVSKCLASDSLPQVDTTPDLDQYKLLELDSQDPEYVQVSKNFKASMKNFKIDKIQKISNRKLMDAYLRKKMEKSWFREETLFCTPLRRHLASICANNFDYTLSVTSNCKYGIGNYFMKDALRSHKENTNGPKVNVMIVAQVLVGNFVQGNPIIKRPPLGYDSCVDTVQNPSVFVIFERDQICPQYVIEYSEVEKPCVIC